MVSWEFCEIFKNSFFTEHFWVAASQSPKHMIFWWFHGKLIIFS